MNVRFPVVAALALLGAGNAAQAVDAAFGNPSGCAASRDDWDNASDLMLLVRPGEISHWESSCTLPDSTFDGREITATCSGEGEEWTIKLSLTVPETRPDVMIYIEFDEETGRPLRTDELWRCQQRGP
jgi:hypothetical protein